MPTKEWIAAHRQVTFWLTPDEYERLRRACNGKSVADKVRQTIIMVLEASDA